MNAPLYRIKVSVYDDNTNEEVAHIDEPMMSQDVLNRDVRSEDNTPTFHRAMRAFESGKSDFEATHYPVDENHD